VGRWDIPADVVKLMDTNEYYSGVPGLSDPMYKNDFNTDSSANSFFKSPDNKVIRLSKDRQYFGPIEISLPESCQNWIRLEADMVAGSRPDQIWNYTQWIVEFYQDGLKVKSNMVRIQRLIPVADQSTHLHFDVKLPAVSFNRCTVTFWNADSSHTLEIDNLMVRCH
jgi:hypothetical protein